MRSRLRVLSALLVCVGVVATSASAGTEQKSSAPPPVERVAREVRTGAKSLIVFVSAAGKEYVATAGSRRPRADQRFRIGSVTKTFTATIVLQLVQEGTLTLSSTLEEHLPGVVPRGGEITIRHLLGHRSGLANVTDYPAWLKRAERSPSTSPINTLRFAASKPLAFRPDSKERYSNTNYIALGLVIEKVTGRSYAEELKERVLDPLALSRTELPATRRLSDLDDAGYNPNLPWAAGAIVSNAHDLSRFYSALLSGRILSAASLRAMKDTAKYGVFGTGLGIFSTDLACGRSFGHDGYIVDYQTLVTASEEGDRVAVVSLRGRGYIPWLGRALLCAEPPLPAGSAPAKLRIAFVSAPPVRGPATLYVVNADGSGQGWLTLTAAAGPRVAWSPDGRRIAFVSNRDGNSDVYVMNADGSGQRRLTRNAAPSNDLAWSPDGRKIAFLSSRDDNSEIYVMNADGSGLRNLTRDPAGDSTFAWSPDGRKIAFSSKRDGTWDVHLMNADGSGQRNLTRGLADDGNPAWSPDGRKIAFGRDGEIYVMNADGSGQRNLTASVLRADPADDGHPSWSPDGRKIAFGRDGEIYVMNADGRGLRRLTRNPASDGSPVFSPDGRKIAFTTKRDGNLEVYVMNPDGSAQRNLTRSPWDEGDLAWSPAQRK